MTTNDRGDPATTIAGPTPRIEVRCFTFRVGSDAGADIASTTLSAWLNDGWQLVYEHFAVTETWCYHFVRLVRDVRE